MWCTRFRRVFRSRKWAREIGQKPGEDVVWQRNAGRRQPPPQAHFISPNPPRHSRRSVSDGVIQLRATRRSSVNTASGKHDSCCVKTVCLVLHSSGCHKQACNPYVITVTTGILLQPLHKHEITRMCILFPTKKLDFWMRLDVLAATCLISHFFRTCSADALASQVSDAWTKITCFPYINNTTADDSGFN